MISAAIALSRGRGRPGGFRRVVLVDYSWRGGIAQYTNRLAAALAERGWAVWVCANQKTKFPPNPSFTPCPIFRPIRTEPPKSKAGRLRKNLLLLWDYLANAYAMKQVLKKVRPEVLHFQSVMVPGLDARRIPRLRRWAGGLALTVHNIAPHDRRSPQLTGHLQHLYRQFDCLFVHAKANQKELELLLQEGGSRSAPPVSKMPPIHVSPLPALLPVLDPSNAAREDSRQKLGIPQEVRLALFLGQARPYKGLDVLIRAFARIAPQVLEARLAIVGPADDFSAYEALLREGNLLERTILRLVFVDDEEAARWLSAADSVVLPHREITQSGVAADAIAAGRAIVASALGGIPEVVRDGENGRLVPPDDPESLARALQELLTNPEILARMGEASSRIAREEQSWLMAAQVTERAYLDIPKRIG